MGDSGGRKVFVDAKIVNMEVRPEERRAYVGYTTHDDGTPLQNATKVEVWETDEAEAAAILFAIRDLKRRKERFKIVCDHESVVLKVNWENERRIRRKSSGVFYELWKEREDNVGLFSVEALEANPAHKFLNQRLKEPGIG